MSILTDLYKNPGGLTSPIRNFLLDPTTMVRLRTATPNDGRGPSSTYPQAHDKLAHRATKGRSTPT